jgi:hypothetical protein
MEVRPVEEAVLRERDERGDRARRRGGVERDREVAAAGADRGGVRDVRGQQRRRLERARLALRRLLDLAAVRVRRRRRQRLVVAAVFAAATGGERDDDQCEREASHLQPASDLHTDVTSAT